MLQPSGPASTPCSRWRLKILWPAFRRLEIPQTILVLFRCDNRRASTRCRPRARNRIFVARDKAAKSVVLSRQRPVGTYHTSHDGRKCGLFSRSLRERETPRVRGGPGRTSNLQPDRYERPALTIELQAPPALPRARQATVPTPLTGWLAIRQCRAGWSRYSTEYPGEFDQLAPFSASSATSPPNSAGVIGLGIPPISVSRATNLGSFSASPAAVRRELLSAHIC